MNHNHDTQGTGRQTPRVLPDVHSLLLLTRLGGGVLNSDVEHLTEVLAQAMGGTTLNTTASCRDVTLNGSGVETTSKFLFLGLLALDHGNGKKLGVNIGIPVKNLQHFFPGSILSQVGSVALLPQELTSTQERLGVLELPSDDGVPLVQAQGQITVTANPLGVVGVHNSLGCRTDSNLLLERS